MNKKLEGQKIAILMDNEGVEEIELKAPMQAVKDAGADVVLLAPDEGEIQAFNHLDKGSKFTVDRQIADASPEDFSVLILPGGVANPDNLRTDPDAVGFISDFLKSGRTVAAICHAPWTLVEAGAVEGRTLTSWPSLKTDIENAGATWVDEEVVVDDNLITSRKPGDLEQFCHTVVETAAA